MNPDNSPPLPEPLAYFLTWTTYGTWLPGDDRWWTKRKRGVRAPNPILRHDAAARMTEPPCKLSARQRAIVEQTIVHHCRIRAWTLHVVNCRSNHVHVVVTAPQFAPAKVREQFKSWCTRELRRFESAQIKGHAGEARKNWWTERGSNQYLNDETSLEAAILYVRDSQDGPR
jgi:REP element-mobilizing transposase RayT